jgi:hypothetical protein
VQPCVVVSLYQGFRSFLAPARLLLYQAEAEGRLAWVEPGPAAQGTDRYGPAMLARTVSPRLRTLSAGYASWTALIVADGAPDSRAGVEHEGIAAAHALIASLQHWRLRPAQIVLMLLGEPERVVPFPRHAAADKLLEDLLENVRPEGPPTTVVWAPSLRGAEDLQSKVGAAYALLALAGLRRAAMPSLRGTGAHRRGHYRLGNVSKLDWVGAVELASGFGDGIRRQRDAIVAARRHIEAARDQLSVGVALVDIVEACDAENVPKPRASTLDEAIARAWFARSADLEAVSDWPLAGNRNARVWLKTIDREAAVAWDRCRRGVLESGERAGAAVQLNRKAVRDELAALNALERRRVSDDHGVREPQLADAEKWAQNASAVAFALEYRPRLAAAGAMTALAGAATVTISVVSQSAVSSLVAGAIAAAATIGTGFAALRVIRGRVTRRVVNANGFAEHENGRLVRFRDDLRKSVKARGKRRIEEWNRAQLEAALESLAVQEAEFRLHERALVAISESLRILAPGDAQSKTGATDDYVIEKPPSMNRVCHPQRFIDPGGGARYVVDGGRGERVQSPDLRGVEEVRFHSIESGVHGAQ